MANVQFTPVTWGKEVATEVIGGIPYKMYKDRPHRVGDLLDFSLRWGSRSHIIHGERALTFAELHSAVLSKAAALSTLGLMAGERIFILGWNSPEWVVNFWACLRAGCVPVLANAWWSSAEVLHGLQALKPGLVLADSRSAEKVPAGWRTGPWVIDTVTQPTTEDANETSQDEEETALIIFTSGTSGLPKAVVLSHRAILARLQMTLHITRKLPHQVDESARMSPCLPVHCSMSGACKACCAQL